MASADELAELRQCMSYQFVCSVPNGVTIIDHILRALNNHILGVHPVVSRTEGGGTAKSTANLPILEESITETQYQAQYQRYCISCCQTTTSKTESLKLYQLYLQTRFALIWMVPRVKM